MNGEKQTRTCGFCFKKFTYDEIPEGSIVYLGICACAECLEKEVTSEFRALLKEAKKGNYIPNTHGENYVYTRRIRTFSRSIKLPNK